MHADAVSADANAAVGNGSMAAHFEDVCTYMILLALPLRAVLWRCCDQRRTKALGVLDV